MFITDFLFQLFFCIASSAFAQLACRFLFAVVILFYFYFFYTNIFFLFYIMIQLFTLTQLLDSIAGWLSLCKVVVSVVDFTQLDKNLYKKLFSDSWDGWFVAHFYYKTFSWHMLRTFKTLLHQQLQQCKMLTDTRESQMKKKVYFTLYYESFCKTVVVFIHSTNCSSCFLLRLRKM